MTYTGTFCMGMTPVCFLRAVSELICEKKITPEEIQIVFIGGSRYVDGKSMEEIIGAEGLSAVAEIRDTLPYRQALAEMVASHVLLLFAPEHIYQIPAKTFEYLASGADIIALSSEGATADLLRATGQGIVVEPDSVEEIKGAVEVCYRKYKAGSCQSKHHTPSVEAQDRYQRKTLTRALVSVLE